MEIENINILKNKVVAVMDNYLLSDIKKINAASVPRQLFNINAYEDIKYNVDINLDKLDGLLEQFELEHSILDRKYYELSKSEYKKICIIICFMMNKPILILENPTDGLDSKSKKTLIKLIKREKRDDKIIFVKSSDSEFLFSACNVIIYRDKTKYIINDNKYNFFANKRLLRNLDIEQPNIMNFYDEVRKSKKVKLINRDNINDLIKEIYRNAK